MMKILMLDIETTPALVYTWALFNQNISVDQIVTPTSLLCFTAKWAGEDKLIYKASVKQEGKGFNDMVRTAHKLLCEADAVCHFNGTSFDLPRLSQEFLRLGLPPPPTVPNIDLKKVVMSKFSMVSSKLAFVGPYLKIGEKVKNSGWDLWRGCLDGDRECWQDMETYNKQDVILLEKLYYKLLPWIDNHPNHALYGDSDEPTCPNCNGTTLQRRGLYRTSANVYVRYQCQDCGRWSRAHKPEKTAAKAQRR